jgi:hypothetical protein
MPSPTRSIRRALLPAALLAALLCTGSASPARADWTSSGTRALEVGADAGLVRPLLFCRMLAGFVLYIPAYGLATLNSEESQREVTELFIHEPIEGLFQRPLGDFGG